MPLVFLGMALVADLLRPSQARIDSATIGGCLNRDYSVVHVGQSVVTLEAQHVPALDPNKLLMITARTGGLMPGGITIERQGEFADIRRALACAHAGDTVSLSGWADNPRVFSPVDLTLTIRVIDPLVIRATGNSLANLRTNDRRDATESIDVVAGAQQIRRRAPELISAALHGVALRQPLLSLVGAGPGTTPTGDDVIVGVLAAFDITGRARAARRLRTAVAPLLPRTTSVSRHYLAAAIDGRFGEHVHDLVAALEKSASTKSTIERALRWGATSGIDLLTGITTGLLNTVQAESAA